jgi:short-subunit dehydrogenase
MRSLRDKRALITGAGRGLGRALAQHLAAAGAEVIVTDRDAGLVEAVVAELRGEGRRAAGYPLDVTDAGQVEEVRRRLHAERGPIDLLVNNAGVVFGGEFLRLPLARHRATVAVNLDGVLALTHTFLPDLIARPEAHLVNVASASALVALPWAASYAATKWAVLGFSESLREELRLQGHRHVGVTAVCPSYVDTGLFAGARPPWGTRLLTPDAVAAATVRAVRRGRELVLLPWTVRLLAGLSALLPRPWRRRLAAWLGVSTSMQGWRGRGEKS